MRISKINFQNFKSNWHIFAYDDDMSRQNREILRARADKYIKDAQYKSPPATPLNIYELNRLIMRLNEPKADFEATQNCEVDEQLLKTAHISHLRPLGCLNSYRGGMSGMYEEKLQIAKQAGIKRVIELREYPYLEEMCKNAGLEYLSYPMTNFSFEHPAFYTEENYVESKMKIFEHITDYTEKDRQDIEDAYIQRYRVSKRNFIDELIEFIQTMQKGNVLVGCYLATYTTDDAMLLNFFFNPDACKMKAQIKPRSGYKTMLAQLYKNLEDEDKRAMGWDKDFDRNFLSRLENYNF